MRHQESNNHRDRVQQLAIECEGVPLVGVTRAAYAVQAAATSLQPELRAELETLRAMERGTIAIVSAHFDDICILLCALGIEADCIAPEDLPLTNAHIVFAGCPHRFSRLDRHDIEPFLQCGGVLVSSDRAAMFPGIARYVPTLGGRPPQMARIFYPNSSCLAGLHPPVTLDPGHRAIDAEAIQSADTRVMATNLASNEPLVVLHRAGSGSILHAVPHWLQSGSVVVGTAVERRQLRAVPSLASIGNSYPQLSLGCYLSQRAMLENLLSGLHLASEVAQKEQASFREHGEGQI